MSTRVIALWIPEGDMGSGYFVLSDILQKMPEDVAILDTRHSYSSAHIVMRLYSSKFPEVPPATVLPRADFLYNSTDGMRIQWPSKEYEDLHLGKLNKKIEESVNKDAEVMEAEGGINLAAIAQIQKAYAEAMTSKSVTGCNHEWFAYGRTAAMKHCKKCGAVSENKVDNS